MISIPQKHLALKSAAFALATLCFALNTQAALVLQLQGSNYNPATGVWTATVGSNATAVTSASGGTATTSTAGTTTSNGSATVGFNGSNLFSLATAIPAGNSYTIFAYARIANTSGTPLTIMGGGGGSFQLRIYLGKQDALQQGQADLGSSSTVLSTTSFSNFNATAGTSGGTYRLNGVADGTVGAGGFTNSISAIGNNATDQISEIFQGSIAEIRIYDTVLTDAERLAVENQFTASYVNVPEPSTWVMMIGGLALLVGVQRFRANKA